MGLLGAPRAPRVAMLGVDGVAPLLLGLQIELSEDKAEGPGQGPLQSQRLRSEMFSRAVLVVLCVRARLGRVRTRYCCRRARHNQFAAVQQQRHAQPDNASSLRGEGKKSGVVG